MRLYERDVAKATNKRRTPFAASALARYTCILAEVLSLSLYIVCQFKVRIGLFITDEELGIVKFARHL